jgi:hypothetical protein
MHHNVKLILYNISFDAPDTHFDKLCLFSDAPTEKFWNIKKKLLDCKELEKTTPKTECHEVEPN